MSLIYATGNLITSVTLGGYVGPDLFTGVGLDDLTPGGTYSGNGSTDFRVEIDASVPSPDTFKWSNDGGVTWEATGVAITGAAQTLENGVTITFGAIDGHTVGDLWDFVAGNVDTEDTIYVKENLYNERPSFPYRATSVTSLWIMVDLGADTPVSIAAVINHNFVAPSTFQLRGYTQATGAPKEPGDATPVADFTGNFTFCSDNNNSAIKVESGGSPISLRYICLLVIDVGNTNNLEIGEFILQVYSSFSTMYLVDEEEGITITVAEEPTHYGQDHDNYYSDNIDFVLSPIKQEATSGDIDAIRTFLKDIQGATGRFILCRDDTYITSKCEVYYVKVVGQQFMAKLISKGYPELRQWNIPLKELTKGISML